jgi:hypothetical protein
MRVSDLHRLTASTEHAAGANLVSHPERGEPTTDDNREELVRTKAFYIWLAKVVLRTARMRIGTWRLN